MTGVPCLNSGNVLGHAAKEIAKQFRGRVAHAVQSLELLRARVAKIRRRIDNMQVQIAALCGFKRGLDQARRSAMRSGRKKRNVAPAVCFVDPGVRFGESGVRIRGSKIRENTAQRFTAMTGRHSCTKPKIRMTINQAQQFAADVTACSQDNGIDTHDFFATILFTPGNLAIASPSATPLVKAFIAGSESRSVI